MLTESGLLLAGLAQDPPLAAGVDMPQAAASPLLRLDRSEQGALAFFDAAPDGCAAGRFVLWLPAACVPDLPDLCLRVVSRAGRTHRIAVRPESYRTFAAHGLPALYPQFTPLFDNMVELTQAPGHPLREMVRILAGALAAGAAAALARPAATGAFDFIADDLAHGWAWDARLPAARQLVEIVDAAGAVRARGHAEHYRPDLPAAGIGDGHHHFRITLPLSLRDGAAHRLSARLPDSGIVLAGAAHDYRAAPLAFFDIMPAPDTFDRARRLPSDAACAAALQIHALIDNAQPQAAHEAALALLADHGDSGVACVKLGEALLLMAQGAAAAQAYLRAQAADPLCPYACLGLGNSRAVCGEWVEAENAYRAGLALGAACAPLAARLAQVQPHAFTQQMRMLIETGATREAVAAVTDHLFAHPADEEAFILLEQALSPDPLEPLACAQARCLKAFELLIGEAAKRKGRTTA